MPLRSTSRRSCGMGASASCSGIGTGIEARLNELVEHGDIAELAELRQSKSLELAAFGRLLGIGAKRATEIGAALGIATIEEFRQAARQGRLTSVPGMGEKTAARIVAALAQEHLPRPRGLLLPQRTRADRGDRGGPRRGPGRRCAALDGHLDAAGRRRGLQTIRQPCAAASPRCPRSWRCSTRRRASRPRASRSSSSSRPPASSARRSCARRARRARGGARPAPPSARRGEPVPAARAGLAAARDPRRPARARAAGARRARLDPR